MSMSTPVPLVDMKETATITSGSENVTTPYKPDEPYQCWIKNCKCTPDCIAWTPGGCRILLLLESIASGTRIGGTNYGTTD